MTDDHVGAPFTGEDMPGKTHNYGLAGSKGGSDNDDEKDDRKDRYKRRLYCVFCTAAVSVVLLVCFGPAIIIAHPSGYMFMLFAVPLSAIIMAGLIASWSRMPLVVNRQQD